MHLQDHLLSCQLQMITLHIPSGYGGNVVHGAAGSKRVSFANRGK